VTYDHEGRTRCSNQAASAESRFRQKQQPIVLLDRMSTTWGSSPGAAMLAALDTVLAVLVLTDLDLDPVIV